jgi:hypothetical protein
MKYSITLILLTLILTGCGSREAKLHKQMTGTWTNSNIVKITLASDGSLVTRWKQGVTYQGTWTIQNGEFVSTITNCIPDGTTNFEAVGSVDRGRIISVDAHHLVYEIQGQTISLRR